MKNSLKVALSALVAVFASSADAAVDIAPHVVSVQVDLAVLGGVVIGIAVAVAAIQWIRLVVMGTGATY